uniref:Uncharacterized protein n=1 Tax=Micrurus spixii TaxID=129469 RepID=A0A2D4M100_9SAUR
MINKMVKFALYSSQRGHKSSHTITAGEFPQESLQTGKPMIVKSEIVKSEKPSSHHKAAGHFDEAYKFLSTNHNLTTEFSVQFDSRHYRHREQAGKSRAACFICRMINFPPI